MQHAYTQDEIDAFVKGQLSPEERSIFLQKIKEDPALLDAVAATRFQLDVANEIIRQETLAKLKAWDTEKKTLPPPSSARTPMPSRWLWWAVAAMSATLVVVAIFWLKNNERHNESAEQVASSITDSTSVVQPPKDTTNPTGTHQPSTPKSQKKPPTQTPAKPLPKPPQASAEPSPYEPSSEHVAMLDALLRNERGSDQPRRTRGQSASNQSPLKEGNSLIAQGQYPEAITKLQMIQKADADNYWTAQMYIGDALFFQKKYREAEQAYLAVQKQGDDFQDKLRWRLAAVYSAQGQKDRLKAHLQGILSDTSHLDYDRAKRLLNVIR